MTKDKKISLAAGMGMLLCAFLWGFAFVVVKTSLDIIPPVYMMAFRFTLAFLVLCIIFLKRLGNITKTTLLRGFIIGLFLFLGYLTQTVGCKYTTAGKNAFLTTVYVILVPFLHFFINKKPVNKYHIVSAILAITGIGFLSLQGDRGVNVGDLLTLAAGLMFTFQIVFIDRYTEEEDPVLLTILQIGVTALLSWMLAPLVEGAPGAIVISSPLIISIAYLGLGSTMLAFLLQNVCQKYTHPAVASVALSMESLFGVLCSALLIGEYMTGRMKMGCVLMFAAILLSQTIGGSEKRGVREGMVKDV